MAEAKLTILMENLQFEIDDKQYSISIKDRAIVIQSDDGVEVIEKSERGRWLKIK